MARGDREMRRYAAPPAQLVCRPYRCLRSCPPGDPRRRSSFLCLIFFSSPVSGSRAVNNSARRERDLLSFLNLVAAPASCARSLPCCGAFLPWRPSAPLLGVVDCSPSSARAVRLCMGFVYWRWLCARELHFLTVRFVLALYYFVCIVSSPPLTFVRSSSTRLLLSRRSQE